MTGDGMVDARCCVEVVAGILPGTPMQDVTRRWWMTSEQWANADQDERVVLLCDLSGKANGYSTYLMLQPDRFNWVRTEWVWF